MFNVLLSYSFQSSLNSNHVWGNKNCDKCKCLYRCVFHCRMKNIYVPFGLIFDSLTNKKDVRTS